MVLFAEPQALRRAGHGACTASSLADGKQLAVVGQTREHLVQERLSISKGEILNMTQECFPGCGVEGGTETGLIVFGESDSAGVVVGEKRHELCGNGPGMCGVDGKSGSGCRSTQVE